MWLHASAYSAKLPPVVCISWKAATRSPTLNSVMSEPTEWIVPAMSSPWLKGLPVHSGYCGTDFELLEVGNQGRRD